MRTPFFSFLLLLLLATHASGASLERWIYVAQNLWPEENMPKIEKLLRRAAADGYTHVLLTDSKFAKLGDMDERYFRHVNAIRQLATDLHLEIVPALFPIGYSNDILWHDPNLIEALPVKDAVLELKNGTAYPVNAGTNLLNGGDLDNLALWNWHDPTVTSDNGAILIRDPKGQNARISQKVKLIPFHQYHLKVRVKTQDFKGTPEVKILAGNQGLNYDNLGVQKTQDWQTEHVVFNSLSNHEANVYLGCWGGNTGSLWFDDATLEECDFVNLVRRDGAPLRVQNSKGDLLKEGKDFEELVDSNMGVHPWKGSYDVWHEPPLLKASLPDGTILKVSYYHGVTVNDGQANICPSEPKTLELLRDQARRMHQAWQAHGYMMSHDEIRVLNWCEACQKRHLDAGPLLAENLRQCAQILREVNPGGRIYVWSDMFDPNHNAHANYYLVRGDLTGSWEGLDKDIIVLPWYFEKRRESLAFFAARGNRQVIAGYYDHAPAQILDWLSSAHGLDGILGVMYTTWEQKYDDLEKFSELLQKHESAPQPK